MPTVVIVGGGYAGIAVARGVDDDAQVTLVDPRDAFVNVACSLRALVREDWVHRPFFDYAALLDRGCVVRGEAMSADPCGVTLTNGERIEADVLVLATGSSYPYPARPRTHTTTAADARADLTRTRAQLRTAGRVLIVGAGPVGLELAGEIRQSWPDKDITIVDRSAEVLPGYLPEVAGDLRRQLQELDIELRLNTTLTELPTVPDATASTFTVRTAAGADIEADIWFRCFGARPNTAYLARGALGELTEHGTIAVDDHLNVVGHPSVYALGDVAALPDAKMATWAQTQAETVGANIRAQLRGEQPTPYHPASVGRIVLPLGTGFGVGQLPSPAGGAVPATIAEVSDRKGTDLFTARYAERFTATQRSQRV